MLALECEGADVTTVEGLTSDGQLHPLQDEFARSGRSAVRILHAGNSTDGERLCSKITRIHRVMKFAKALSGILLPLHGILADFLKRSSPRF